MSTELSTLIPIRETLRKVLNSVKNPRRRAILLILKEYNGLTLETIQDKLKGKGFYHSKSTIETCYLSPLIRAKLVVKKGQLYSLSSLGEKILTEIEGFEWPPELSKIRKCYEELLLIALNNGPLTFKDIALFIPRNEISRVIGRIKKFLMRSKDRVYYFVSSPLYGDVSPSERKVLDIIREAGEISTSEIIKKAPFKTRTVFKRLKSLKEKGIINSFKQPLLYSLTPEGKKISDFLLKIASIIREEEKAKEELKNVIIDYLFNKSEPVSEIELIEECISPFFENYFKRPIEPDEFQKIKRELKKSGIITGDPYSGYQLNKELLQKYPLPKTN
ncbi:MAG TPA: hypothetical protein ENG63_01840 [Candidatus Desulfofervidus auxilii]|uniref:Uncharacterized protein n=1 Tax=Desulfofervidus auxilii TaxID=1621989 RepID=A0A7C0Y8C6_DESA2|nr:hypothetical protein [Candidatus Baldrarchaeota archaeon]HDD43591.1 hypothetical protein [Candidatus Desulfofervidus auxilii]